MILFCALASGLAWAYGEYLANKQAARARSIELLKQIEAREAASALPN